MIEIVVLATALLLSWKGMSAHRAIIRLRATMRSQSDCINRQSETIGSLNRVMDRQHETIEYSVACLRKIAAERDEAVKRALELETESLNWRAT